jgi:POT family proton-dependent oligopeptide transporter
MVSRREYAFTKAPKRMKSVVMAFSQLQTALASALNFALVSVNVEDKFEWLFASFAITAAIFAGLFYWTCVPSSFLALSSPSSCWIYDIPTFAPFPRMHAFANASHSFRDLDKAEVALNLIGTGERAGFVGEREEDQREKA